MDRSFVNQCYESRFNTLLAMISSEERRIIQSTGRSTGYAIAMSPMDRLTLSVPLLEETIRSDAQGGYSERPRHSVKTSKPTLVLMAGFPGAGKTTLANRLGCELGWRVIDKDNYRETFMKQGLDREAAATKAYDRSFAEIDTSLMVERESVIFDTAALLRFIPNTVKEIVDISKNAQLKVILCVADRDLRKSRLRKLNKPEEDITVKFDPFTLKEYLNYFEKYLPKNRLTVFTDVPIEGYLAEVKQYVTS